MSGIGIVLALLGVLVAMPLVSLVRGALEQGWSATVQRLLGADVTTALWHTVLLAMIVTAVSVSVGTALAMAFARGRLRATVRWRLALLVPVLVPQFAITRRWTKSFGSARLL